MHSTKIIFLVLLFFCIGCSTTSRLSDNPARTTAVNPYENSVDAYGAVGDGKHDDTNAFLKCIEKLPIRKIQNVFGRVKGWGVFVGGEIVLTPGKTYRITKPLLIPSNRNVTFRCNAIGGATIIYDGPGDYAIDFQNKAINTAIGVNGINFWKGGIRLQGSTRGRIRFENNLFVDTKGPAIAIVDEKDLAGKRKSFGNVNWLIEYNDFNNCEYGIYIDSKSILLGTIRKNRFNMTKKSPLYIDGDGILIDNNEFQSVLNTNYPYIHLKPMKNPTGYITISNNRFGSESIKWPAQPYRPPQNYILLDKGEFQIMGVLINANYFFTNKEGLNTKNTGDYAIKILNQRVLNLQITNGNVFLGFNENIIDDSGKGKEWLFKDNIIYRPQKKTFKVDSPIWKKN